MSKKYKITLEVEEGQETTIKPLGETMTSKAGGDGTDGGTGTTTITNGPRGVDAGADADTDM
jgi:hypothetical protein